MQNNKPELISVVIPVYNTEKYLERSITSVLKQTYTNIELILIDDGSTDKSGIICDDFADKYSNIFVFHKENKGLSHTRNYGVKKARGEYLFFLDSDDYIIKECLSVLHTNLKKYEADVSGGSFNFFDDSSSECDYDVINKVYVCSGRKACEDLLYGKRFYTSSCNILIKNEIAKNIEFPNGKFHEDEQTTFRYFLESNKAVISYAKTYYYYQRIGSIMHSFGQPVIDEIYSADNYVEFFKNKDVTLLRAAFCRKYILYNETMDNYPELQVYEPQMYNEIRQYLKKNALHVLRNRKIPLYLKKKAIINLVRSSG